MRRHHLDYATPTPPAHKSLNPDADHTPRNFAALSLVIGVATWLIGYGGFALWDSRTVPRPPLSADLDHDLGLLALALLTLAIGPILGACSAWRALARKPAREGIAIASLSINLWVWGFPLALSATRSWRLGIALTLAGTVGATCWGVWLDFLRHPRQPKSP